MPLGNMLKQEESRGLDMIKEYDEFPVFYFSNHNSVVGPGDICHLKNSW